MNFFVAKTSLGQINKPLGILNNPLCAKATILIYIIVADDIRI